MQLTECMVTGSQGRDPPPLAVEQIGPRLFFTNVNIIGCLFLGSGGGGNSPQWRRGLHSVPRGGGVIYPGGEEGQLILLYSTFRGIIKPAEN
jgi:hypothetical protein